MMQINSISKALLFYFLCIILIDSPSSLAAKTNTIKKPTKPQEALSDGISAKILYCSDGDTCRIKINDRLWLNVRLAGVDCPETAKNRGKKKPGQPMSEDAKQFINQRLKGQDALIRQVDLDSYNRPIVEIFHEQILINTLLLEKGLAEVYQGKTKRIDRKQYEMIQQKAQKDKIGIWSLKDYESPKTYRKRFK